jgi:hypothetical protein
MTTLRASTADFSKPPVTVNNPKLQAVVARNIIGNNRFILLDMSKTVPTLVFGTEVTPQDWKKAQQTLGARPANQET